MYLEGVNSHLETFPDFLFIASEKEPPYATAIYKLDKMTAAEGSNLFHDALQKYKLCKERNDWPGYGDEIQTIEIPRYAFKTLAVEEFPAMSGKAI